MTTKCLPRGFGGYGGKQSSGSCKSKSKCRPVACFAINRSCEDRQTCKVPKGHHQLERVLKDCKFVFTDGETDACCDCGDLVSLLGSGCIGIRVDDKCTVYIDGVELRKKIRTGEDTCNVPSVPTSDDPNDYIVWKSLMDDFIGVGSTLGDLCCQNILFAVQYFADVLEDKFGECVEGDAMCTFKDSGHPVADFGDSSINDQVVLDYVTQDIGCVI